MDSTLIIAGAAFVTGSVVLSVGIERLISRLGVSREDPEDRSDGFRDVLRALGRWGTSRIGQSRDPGSSPPDQEN